MAARQDDTKQDGMTGPSTIKDPGRLTREVSSRDYAARLLTAPAALMQLSLVEAKIVVSYMRPERVDAGQTFITEGDADNTGFMVLLLDGEVLVESITVSRTTPVTITILGPGSLIGEMGILDTGPRSASCTASTDIQCAVRLEHYQVEIPKAAAPLLKYAERLFSRQAFIDSMTASEKAMRK